MINTLGDSKLFAACEGDFHICHSPHCTLLSPDAEGEPQMPGHHHLGPLHSFRSLRAPSPSSEVFHFIIAKTLKF